ncbi:hypothetical protein EKO04_008109 [Ascochyta lentis]|uniref:Cytochrome P450 n=1 Tax=Ascochyta lentis TaxID=205686 RepID=A0A8H7J0P2_9PLEO|nr:hypothetical protein EKO04_008109 [Ascochyta lentis]
MWLIVHALLIPDPIHGIPYKTLSRLQPWGDLGSLGIYSGLGFGGEIFDWFSIQCVDLRAPLVQVFMPPISTTHPVLILSDLREVEDIVTKRMSETDRADIMHTWFGLVAPRASIGLKSKSDAYRKQRSLWNVILSPSFLREVVAKNIHDVALELVNLWTKKAEQSQGFPFDARDDIQMAMLEATWRNMFGTPLHLVSIKSESLHLLQRDSSNVVTFKAASMPEFCSILDTLLLCLDWVIQGVTPRGYTWLFRATGILSRAEKRKDEILDNQICTARAKVRHGKSSGKDAMSLVLEKDARMSESTAVTDDALRDEVLELLLTGRSTTSGSFLWVLKYLTDHPTVQRKLRHQLSLRFEKCDTPGSPSAEQIMTASLPYLDAVIAETLRCSATVPVCFRETSLPCTILGHNIPAGTPLVLLTAGSFYQSPTMPHVAEELRSRTSRKAVAHKINHTRNSNSTSKQRMTCFNDFDPSRWIVDSMFNPDAVHMLPFSAGSRGCFGKKIAMLEMRILIVVLIMNFDFPKLAEPLSNYKSVDGLSRKPRQCHVSPRPLFR